MNTTKATKKTTEISCQEDRRMVASIRCPCGYTVAGSCGRCNPPLPAVDDEFSGNAHGRTEPTVVRVVQVRS